MKMAANLIVALYLLIAYHCSGVSSQFTVYPINNTIVNEGDSLTLQCAYINATRITWVREGQVLQDNNSSSSNLTFVSVDHEIHNGSYSCVATTESNMTETVEFYVLVYYIGDTISITLDTDECSQYQNGLFSGSTVTLTCHPPDAFPTPRVSWFHNEYKVRDFENPNIDFNTMRRVLVITGIYTNQSGEWNCVADNDVGTPVMSEPYNINIPVLFDRRVVVVSDEFPPERTENVLFALGSKLYRMNCSINPPFSADGLGISNLFWSLNGVRILPSDNYKHVLNEIKCLYGLTIPIVSEEHAGTYRCHLEVPGAPDVKSDPVTLVIATIRQTYSISMSPSSPIGNGKQVEITCTPEGPPGNVPESLGWRFQINSTIVSTELVPNDRILIQDQGTKVIITEARVEDTGIYFCLASNEQTPTVEVSIVLVVEATPVVTVTPSNSIVRIGTPLNITCEVDSPRDITFAWFVNGNRLSPTNTRYTITDSTNFSLLSLLSVEEIDLTGITCRGEEAIHFPVSAVLELTEDTNFYLYGGSATRNVTLEKGTEFRLDCDVRGGSGSAVVMWFDGNIEVKNGTKDFSVLSYPNGTYSLVKTSVIVDDEEKDYVCKAIDNMVSLRQQFFVFVTIPGDFQRTPPAETNTTVGHRFQLDCFVSGRPPPKVTWRYRGTPVNNLNITSLQDLGNGSLVFNPAATSHTGPYICSIESPTFEFRQTTLTVLSGSGSGLTVLNSEEVILTSIIVVVAIILLIAACIITIFCTRFYCSQRSKTTGRYEVKQDSPDGAFIRQPSLRDRKDNSGILSQSPSNDIFDTMHKSPDTAGTFHYPDGNPYSINPTSIQLGVYGASNSALSEKFAESHNSTPLHGTMASTSLFSSDDQTGPLPNFPRSNLELGDVMGEGEFGPVVLGVANHIVSTEDKTLVAVKVLVSREEEEGLRPDLALVDFANQMKLEYTNVASILGICSDSEPYYVIYEYLDQGDLKKFLFQSQPEDGDPPSITHGDMRKIILQVADGMAYLFSQRIIHGDLATRNCLISSSLQVKIADLGIGHDLYNQDYFDNGAQLLPIRWMPPELLTRMEEGPNFSLHSDIWSFGVFCWEVFAYAKLPYGNFEDDEILSMIPAGSRLRKPSISCPHELYDLMAQCWHEDPDRRPQFARLCVAIVDLEFDRDDFSQ